MLPHRKVLYQGLFPAHLVSRRVVTHSFAFTSATVVSERTGRCARRSCTHAKDARMQCALGGLLQVGRSGMHTRSREAIAPFAGRMRSDAGHRYQFSPIKAEESDRVPTFLLSSNLIEAVL
jgi:hypothetical protein